MLLTFDPHPRCVLDPENCPGSLTTLEDKVELLHELGIDHVVIIKFSPEIAALTPAAFMKRLTRGLPLRRIVVGHDFRFGRARRGDPAFLARLGTRQGFGVEVVTPLTRGGSVISSSRIRRLLLLGQVRAAAQLLGRDYLFRSTVEHGEKRGRQLGYPTANLRIEGNKLVPAWGVYAVRVEFDGEQRMGAMSIGVRPTFGGQKLTVEVYLIDFNGDLYDRVLTVWFVQRLRGERKFASIAGLHQQMARDVENVKRILARS
jgi:riboflavin kinase/FMN adenylyltransferase